MNDQEFMEALRYRIPIQTVEFSLVGKRPALGVVDPLRGFCEVGCGPLAPPVPDSDIASMVGVVDTLSKIFVARKWPVKVFRDRHIPGIQEEDYSLHCEEGSGQELLMPQLQWMEKYPGISFLDKTCINGFVAGFNMEGKNEVLSWVEKHQIDTMVFVGICTDVCDLDIACTFASLKNHYVGRVAPLVPCLQKVVVYVPGCATYHFPRETVESLGLRLKSSHPRDVMQHIGLKVMADRGVVLAHSLKF